MSSIDEHAAELQAQLDKALQQKEALEFQVKVLEGKTKYQTDFINLLDDDETDTTSFVQSEVERINGIDALTRPMKLEPTTTSTSTTSNDSTMAIEQSSDEPMVDLMDIKVKQEQLQIYHTKVDKMTKADILGSSLSKRLIMKKATRYDLETRVNELVEVDAKFDLDVKELIKQCKIRFEIHTPKTRMIQMKDAPKYLSDDFFQLRFWVASIDPKVLDSNEQEKVIAIISKANTILTIQEKLQIVLTHVRSFPKLNNLQSETGVLESSIINLLQQWELKQTKEITSRPQGKQSNHDTSTTEEYITLPLHIDQLRVFKGDVESIISSMKQFNIEKRELCILLAIPEIVVEEDDNDTSDDEENSSSSSSSSSNSSSEDENEDAELEAVVEEEENDIEEKDNNLEHKLESLIRKQINSIETIIDMIQTELDISSNLNTNESPQTVQTVTPSVPTKDYDFEEIKQSLHSYLRDKLEQQTPSRLRSKTSYVKDVVILPDVDIHVDHGNEENEIGHDNQTSPPFDQHEWDQLINTSSPQITKLDVTHLNMTADLQWLYNQLFDIPPESDDPTIVLKSRAEELQQMNENKSSNDYASLYRTFVSDDSYNRIIYTQSFPYLLDSLYKGIASSFEMTQMIDSLNENYPGYLKKWFIPKITEILVHKDKKQKTIEIVDVEADQLTNPTEIVQHMRKEKHKAQHWRFTIQCSCSWTQDRFNQICDQVKTKLNEMNPHGEHIVTSSDPDVDDEQKAMGVIYRKVRISSRSDPNNTDDVKGDTRWFYIQVDCHISMIQKSELINYLNNEYPIDDSSQVWNAAWVVKTIGLIAFKDVKKIHSMEQFKQELDKRRLNDDLQPVVQWNDFVRRFDAFVDYGGSNTSTSKNVKLTKAAVGETRSTKKERQIWGDDETKKNTNMMEVNNNLKQLIDEENTTYMLNPNWTLSGYDAYEQGDADTAMRSNSRENITKAALKSNTDLYKSQISEIKNAFKSFANALNTESTALYSSMKSKQLEKIQKHINKVKSSGSIMITKFMQYPMEPPMKLGFLQKEPFTNEFLESFGMKSSMIPSSVIDNEFTNAIINVMLAHHVKHEWEQTRTQITTRNNKLNDVINANKKTVIQGTKEKSVLEKLKIKIEDQSAQYYSIKAETKTNSTIIAKHRNSLVQNVHVVIQTIFKSLIVFIPIQIRLQMKQQTQYALIEFQRQHDPSASSSDDITSTIEKAHKMVVYMLNKYCEPTEIRPYDAIQKDVISSIASNKTEEEILQNKILTPPIDKIKSKSKTKSTEKRKLSTKDKSTKTIKKSKTETIVSPSAPTTEVRHVVLLVFHLLHILSSGNGNFSDLSYFYNKIYKSKPSLPNKNLNAALWIQALKQTGSAPSSFLLLQQVTKLVSQASVVEMNEEDANRLKARLDAVHNATPLDDFDTLIKSEIELSSILSPSTKIEMTLSESQTAIDKYNKRNADKTKDERTKIMERYLPDLMESLNEETKKRKQTESLKKINNPKKVKVAPVSPTSTPTPTSTLPPPPPPPPPAVLVLPPVESKTVTQPQTPVLIIAAPPPDDTKMIDIPVQSVAVKQRKPNKTPKEAAQLNSKKVKQEVLSTELKVKTKTKPKITPFQTPRHIPITRRFTFPLIQIALFC